ncbi:hypothetical protein IAI53_01060 [Thauera sp. CAU 1555]|jgi:hypothetical protein|uniref:Uncharacterized protein n=1 Tax=Thauera sedimentorum TaxID=2767595 RepID=A0ABR9B541_9RHOO|nr:hypothetical protein [Thauera sedimentorum]MBC9070546.1 hypothetical protein [Thauera sedimentorum]MBD8501465.1 hypothetical protein [Thauera sedimentorum]
MKIGLASTGSRAALLLLALLTTGYAQAAPPEYETYVKVQRIGIGANTITAGNRTYQISNEASIWIDHADTPSPVSMLSQRMVGWTAGLNAYESADGWIVNSMHLFPPTGDQQPRNR